MRLSGAWTAVEQNELYPQSPILRWEHPDPPGRSRTADSENQHHQRTQRIRSAEHSRRGKVGVQQSHDERNKPTGRILRPHAPHKNVRPGLEVGGNVSQTRTEHRLRPSRDRPADTTNAREYEILA